MTQPQTDLDKFLSTWPMFGIVAPSGEGKTWLTASLTELPWAKPMRLIDLDAGAATIAAFAERRDLIDYRAFKGDPDSLSLTRWVIDELKAAQSADCGSIALEGLGKLYMLLQGEMTDAAITPGMKLAELAKKLDGHHGQALYKAGAGIMRAIITQASLLNKAKQQQAHKGGRGGIIVITLTTRVSQVTENGRMSKITSPELSENVAGSLMSACDGFFDLVRDGNNTRLLVDKDAHHPLRKARNPAVASRLAALRNPTFGAIVDAYLEGKQEISAALNTQS
jgi:hypothetical protein